MYLPCDTMPTEAILDEDRLHRLNVFAMAGTVSRYEVIETDHGTKLIVGVEVFRVGTFKDSVGEQRTWTLEQLAQMVSNFALLREAETFPNVPLRVDHSWSVESVIGYIDALYVVGDKLVADLEITEPDHFDKFDRGTYRSRSLEVGMYEDNNGTAYYPVVMGLAFVDIPAVEGLHRGAHRVGCFRYQDGEENPTVPTETKPAETPAPFKFRVNGTEETDYAKVQNYVAQLEGEAAAAKTRIESLEAFAKDTVSKHRADYVSGLASVKKIAATQIDGLKLLVEMMTDDQFKAFTDAYDAAPTLSILGNHGNAVTNPDGSGTQVNAEDAERKALEDTVSMLHRSGMSEADVAKTSSYKRLAAFTGAGK